MFKKIAAVAALALASLNIASAASAAAYTFKPVDLRNYVVTSSSDTSKVITLKPGAFYTITPTTAEDTAGTDYYVLVQCAPPKKTLNGKNSRAFVSYVNVAGQYTSNDYTTVYFYNAQTGDFIFNLYK